MFLEPDLTGQNPLYFVDNFLKVIYKTDQKFEFDTPVVTGRNLGDTTADKITLELVRIGTANIPLLYGIDWGILPDDIDHGEISRIKVQDPTFKKEIIKSVTIIRIVVLDTKINAAFHRLYPLHYRSPLINDNPPELTPTAWGQLIKDVEYSLSLTRPIKDVHSIPEGPKPKLLEEDPFKNKLENYITEEAHDVNVPDNRYLIYPICMDFFSDSVEVFHVLSETTRDKLILDEDYLIFGMDVKKTQVTSNTGTICSIILIKKPIVGTIHINYHAYGGVPTIYDTRAITENINNMLAYLKDSEFLTENGVSQIPFITKITEKIRELELTMRHLLVEGKPSYGDVTSGGVLKKKIKASDTKLHWYTIASLYTVDGSSQITVADRFHCRIKSVISKFMFDMIVAVDITAQSVSDALDVNIISEVFPKKYIPYGEATELEFAIRPQVRVIWNEHTNQESGILLQLGWELKEAAEEIIAIEDISGKQSCWRLVNEVPEAVGPEDILVQLPNPLHMWENLNIDSRQIATIIPFKRGYLAWKGATAINRSDVGSGAGTNIIDLDTHLLDTSMDINNFTKIRLDLGEIGGSEQSLINAFSIYVNMSNHGAGERIGSHTFEYNGKLAKVIFKISKDDIKEKLVLELYPDIDAGATSNELDLFQVVVFACPV